MIFAYRMEQGLADLVLIPLGLISQTLSLPVCIMDIHLGCGPLLFLELPDLPSYTDMK